MASDPSSRDAAARRHALVLGGAGFVGSAICRHLLDRGWHVVACDGLMPRTESGLVGFARLPAGARRVERVVSVPGDLADLMAGADLVVDAMGWTSHWGALEDPAHDLALNLVPHIALAQALSEARPRLLVYLGSRHQYGRIDADGLDETAPLVPVDVQGIHKTAAERHLALAAARHGVAAVSLRFGNTFGPGQPLRVKDVGLIGDFLRRAAAGESLEVYGTHRRRTVHYAADLAAAVARLADARLEAGLTPLNVPGEDVAIHDLAQAICAAVGRGRAVVAPLDPEVAAIDIGDRPLDCSRFQALCPGFRPTALATALAETWRDAAPRLAEAGV